MIQLDHGKGAFEESEVLQKAALMWEALLPQNQDQHGTEGINDTEEMPSFFNRVVLITCENGLSLQRLYSRLDSISLSVTW